MALTKNIKLDICVRRDVWVQKLSFLNYYSKIVKFVGHAEKVFNDYESIS